MIVEELRPLGVRVTDLPLQAVGAPEVDRLRRLLADHGVVVLPGQQLGDEEFVRFLGGFGALMFSTGETPVDGFPDLNVISNVGRATPPRSTFHVDTTYVSRPPAYTALRAVAIPDAGGETLFSDQYRAYDRLPADLHDRMQGRTITHVVTGLELGEDDETAAEHPVFRVHPVSGRTSLYLTTPARCAAVSGPGAGRGGAGDHLPVRPLHDARTTCCGTAWSSGDVVMWDNRLRDAPGRPRRRRRRPRDAPRHGRRLGRQESLEGLGVVLRLLPRQQVPGPLEDLEGRVRQQAGQLLAVRRRVKHVVPAADDQGRHLQAGEALAEVEPGDGVVRGDQLGRVHREAAAGPLDGPAEVSDAPGAGQLSLTEATITFDRVSFAYGTGTPALTEVSLEVKRGQTAALVGPSGGGKSTILNLIPRFYDVTGGGVSIDGQDVRGVTLASLRHQIALVTQEPFLFDDTLYANIAYARPEASREEVEAAARAAAAHEFITALPHGYDTNAGEAGTRLSGGQRQRIAIARAFLKNAPILLLDEATSALDTESEQKVQEALERLMHGRTTLMIAHRLSTVRNADRIYVIDAGKVVEQGTHADLSSQGGLYARLARAQNLDVMQPAAILALGGVP